MTYYSEAISSPVCAEFISSQYGVAPVAEPAQLPGLGIYPLVECDPAYTPARYEKRGDRYEAIPLPISNKELEAVALLRRQQVNNAELYELVVLPWTPDEVYGNGRLATYNGKTYSKVGEDQQAAPDDVSGAWDEVLNAPPVAL